MENEAEPQETPSQRLRVALDLFEFGVEMMAQKFRREAPNATEEEIRARLETWLQHRPGAEFGDGVGRLVDGPRR